MTHFLCPRKVTFDTFVLPLLLVGLSVCISSGCRSTSATVDGQSSDPAIQHAVRPGEPGATSDVLSKRELVRDDLPPHTQADTDFMQGMIAHHAQALVMTEMVPSRTERPDLLLLSRRIDVSQGSEIKLMQRWLRMRGELVPMIQGVNSAEELDAASDAERKMSSMHAGHVDSAEDATAKSTLDHSAHNMQNGMKEGMGSMDGEPMLMPGMLTPDDLAKLSAANGDEFYKLFLQYMIGHHQGALTMVVDLFAVDGAGQDTDIFLFASDVDVDQRIEIERMQQMWASLR